MPLGEFLAPGLTFLDDNTFAQSLDILDEINIRVAYKDISPVEPLRGVRFAARCMTIRLGSVTTTALDRCLGIQTDSVHVACAPRRGITGDIGYY